MAGTFTRPTASDDGTHKHCSPECVSEFEVVVGRTRTATATTTHRELDEEAIESTPSNVQQNILQPNRLPPNPAVGAKERVRRPAAEILEEYKECNLEEQKDRLRFCKEKLDCCRLMVQRSARFSKFVKDPKGDVALFNQYRIKIPDGAEGTIEVAERALTILSNMEKLKDISLTDMVFIHDLYESLEGGCHVSGDTHWRKCKFYI